MHIGNKIVQAVSPILLFFVCVDFTRPDVFGSVYVRVDKDLGVNFKWENRSGCS